MNVLSILLAAALFIPGLRDIPNESSSQQSELLPACDVLIDVGHGGVDGGTSYGKVLEKNINLNVAKKLYLELTKRGIPSALNRIGDYALSDENRWLQSRSRHRKDLAQRKELGKEIGAKMIVSLHANWSSNAADHGAYVLYKKNNEEGKAIAEAIQSRLNRVYDTPGRRPVRGRTYYILNRSESPAVIVEMGYVSNARDRDWMQDDHKQFELAKAITAGIGDYMKRPQ